MDDQGDLGQAFKQSRGGLVIAAQEPKDPTQALAVEQAMLDIPLHGQML
jgi:hypothetical protein